MIVLGLWIALGSGRGGGDVGSELAFLCEWCWEGVFFCVSLLLFVGDGRFYYLMIVDLICL